MITRATGAYRWLTASAAVCVIAALPACGSDDTADTSANVGGAGASQSDGGSNSDSSAAGGQGGSSADASAEGSTASGGSSGSTAHDASSDGDATNGSSGGSSGAGGSAGSSGSGGSAGSAGASGGGGSNGTGGATGTGGSSGAAGSAGSSGGGGAAGSLDAGADGSADIPTLCTAIGNASCGTTTDDCITRFSAYASCSQVQACLACVGGSPSVSCRDGGGFEIVGCDSECSNFDSACLDGGPAPGVATLCNAIVNAGCPETYDECLSMFAPYGVCNQILLCTQCTGDSPTATCDDGGLSFGACDSVCTGFDENCLGHGDGGDAQAPTKCLGAFVVPQSSSGSTADNPQVVPTGEEGVALFGQSDGHGGFSEPGGVFELTGLSPNIYVSVQIVTSPCDDTLCPPDISFGLGPADGGTTVVSSSPGSCGSAIVQADDAGHLYVFVGKSGEAGAENGVGVVLRPNYPVDGGSDGD